MKQNGVKTKSCRADVLLEARKQKKEQMEKWGIGLELKGAPPGKWMSKVAEVNARVKQTCFWQNAIRKRKLLNQGGTYIH